MYSWIESKRKAKVHEIDSQTGITFCKVENNGEHTRSRLTVSEVFPEGRRGCWCCKEIKRLRLHDATNGRLDTEYRRIMA